jgi:hypothetical protein
MEFLLILLVVGLALALVMSARRRRFLNNRGRGAVTGRWNRRI